MGIEASAVAPASSGSRLVFAYWCASGCRGTSTPAMRPMTGPQNPAAETTWSAGKMPRSVTTAVTLPSSRSMPTTV